MQLTCQTDKYAVIDDLLPPEQFANVWKVLPHDGFSAEGALKWLSSSWGFDGGVMWATPARKFNDIKDGPLYYTAALGLRFQELAKLVGNLVTPGWDDISIHAQVFGRGTKLHWHADTHSLGSFTWYAHPEWKPHWGGEMLIAEGVPLWAQTEPKPPSEYFDRSWEEKVFAVGMNTCIAPKPNRCVLVAPGVWHSVNRVDPDAGDALRVSVVGFLVKNKKEN